MESPTWGAPNCVTQSLSRLVWMSPARMQKKYMWISKNQHLDTSIGANLHSLNQNSTRKGTGMFPTVSAYLLQPLATLVTWAAPNATFQEAFKVPGIAFVFWPSLKCRLTNDHAVLRFEFYVVPAAAECGEGGRTRRSSSSKTTFRTEKVEEKCSERDRRMVGKWGRGKEKRTRVFFL